MNKYFETLAKIKSTQKPNLELKDMATLDKLFTDAKKNITDFADIEKQYKGKKGNYEKTKSLREKADEKSNKELSKYSRLEDAFYSAKQKMEEAKKALDRARDEEKGLRKIEEKDLKDLNKVEKNRTKITSEVKKIATKYSKEVDAFIKNAKKLGVSPNIKKHLDIVFKLKNLTR